MNEETTLPSEVPTDPPTETEALETTDGAVIDETTEETIWEDFSGAAIEETVAETTEPVITVEVFNNGVSDIAHAGLLSNFLICGTLIGLLRLDENFEKVAKTSLGGCDG